MPNSSDTDYINTTDYKKLETRIKELKSVLDGLTMKLDAARKLRYAEVDIESERTEGRLQPDELYIPQHLIDTNIRREQSPYVQYITQSPRAVILEDEDEQGIEYDLLEKDLTKKLRFSGWQLSSYANIDGFQSNGYGVMETIQDLTNPGEIGREYVSYGDFGFVSDTRDIQAAELIARAYYFPKTKLVGLCGDGLKPTLDDWNKTQVDKVISAQPSDEGSTSFSSDSTDKSLYKIYKFMFRVGGIVQVAWACPDKCDDWLRQPRPLFLGRRKLTQPQGMAAVMQQIKSVMNPNAMPPSEQQYETQYPYFVFPYLISENDTISHLKGRVFLDQDVQEAVTSLLSSMCTKARRSAGLYGAMDGSDPNEDVLMQKNITLRSGCIINKKVSFTELSAPDPSMFSAIQLLVSANQNETSQVNFAVNNRKDSRKTAKEIETATSQSQNLSTVQVVLFSIALQQQYSYECGIIKSRVLAGLIKVTAPVMELYKRNWSVKPSGDTDVIEKQQLIQMMQNMWPMIANTPMAIPFLIDLIELMFPVNASKYIMVLKQSQEQAQSMQAQQQQQFMLQVQQMGQSIVELSKHPEFFSDSGQLHALPQLEIAAEKIKMAEKQMKEQAKQKPQQSMAA